MPEPRQTIHPLAQLEFSSRVRKRAQYEAFEFTLVPEGVSVRNRSYADPENHEYTVTVRSGVPLSCTCPADERFAGACKHRVAVAMRHVLLETVRRMQAVTDGGQPADMDTQSDGSHSPTLPSADIKQYELAPGDGQVDPHRIDDDSEDPCDCDGVLDDPPCWECFRRLDG
ncbi:SWIM zinc finger family protein [Salinigranum halophilum]|uniref:SWIM zinc finger family protein n=1 Tax=Salinigranum halophilum TaxID=2565931 RepID=UPI00115F3F0D|nr:SWIM zinc finger family protein [Salinigranum halophilum]